ncbi:MAG: hypothetical protein GQ532_08660, partial [Methylomarinum sp.]|nr:hypothetical protein [Methylomarinum sp.]
MNSGQQKTEGGWTNGQNISQSYLTALCIQVLAPYANGFPSVQSAITLGQTYLYAKRTVDGLWGEDFQTASAILALIATGADQASLQASVTALTARQASDGSWQQDVYSTALALKALHRFQQRAGGVNTSASGTVIGAVVLSGTGEPVIGAKVSSLTQPGLYVFSGADGTFRLTGLASGSQTLRVSKDGYSGTSSVAPVYINQQSDVGTIALALNTDTGIFRGLVFDDRDQTTLDIVNITLTGPQTYQAISNSQGQFELAAITPGDYSLSFNKPGYISLAGQLSVSAGSVVNMNQSMLQTGAFLDDTAGNLTGRIVDGLTGLPVRSAQFNLSNGSSVSSDSTGRFTVFSVSRGSYQASVSATNYQMQSLSFEFSVGLSGQLGDINLFPVSDVSAPGYLTLLGEVVDGVSGLAIQGATIEVIDPALTVSSNTQGEFFITELAFLDVELRISAEGYIGKIYNLSSSGFGDIQQRFVLSPAIVDTGKTQSKLSGVIKDSVSGLPVPNVTIQLADASVSASSDAAGQFVLNNISELTFSVQAFATGYIETSRQLTLSTHASYTLDISLNPLSQTVDDSFQIVTLKAPLEAAGANETRLFEATVANLTDQARDVLIIADVINANGEVVASVTPYRPGTTEVDSHFNFAAQEHKVLTIPWATAQNAPGTYQLVLRIVEPGTLSRALPSGVVLAEAQVSSRIDATLSFSGTLVIQPPITQAGTQTPVQLDALIVNSGNTALDNQGLELSIYHPETNVLIHQVATSIDHMAISDHLIVSFGEWIPSEEGNLAISIIAQQPALLGQVEGQLYVGDKATGTFTVDKAIVPEGDQTVQAKITLEGVDTARGTLIDPLFFAVQQAVSTGSHFTAREALNWQKRNRCMGCHIQTQSLVGVALAYQKGLGDKLSANTMYNMVASSQQSDGGLRANHPQYTKTQTALGLWSLTAWDDLNTSFRTLYKAAKHMYDRRSQSGNQTWWRPDHVSGWWQ